MFMKCARRGGDVQQSGAMWIQRDRSVPLMLEGATSMLEDVAIMHEGVPRVVEDVPCVVTLR